MMNQNQNAYGEFLNPREVRLIRILPAPIERVWAYLTESEKRGTWLAAGKMDLRLHGRVELTFDHSKLSPGEIRPVGKGDCGSGKEFDGEITQYEPPNLLSFTWDGTEAAFELTSLGNETRLVITHKRLTSEGQTIGVAAGWHVHVDFLIARLKGEEPPLFWANHARLEKEYASRLPALT